MDILEVTIIHHVGIVFVFLWFLSLYNWCHPLAYFLSLVYLFLVHERYVMRLRRKLQFEERKQANQRRVLSESETVRWLNHAVERMWPICMEQIASQKILLPIIPWFLEKYKPWTAKKAMVQHLYMGRNPPMFTEMRVLRQHSDDDHLVLELGMNFLTADDMSAILGVKLRKRLGFGMWAKLHITGMHIEGKVLIGVKFLREWPFIGRLRVCFAEPPYFQMTVKPIFTHGLDVTEFPGIAGWLDKLLSIAFEQTLVQPNMLVVDMEKFASPAAESWFKVDEKEPVAYAKVEVVEASDIKPSDPNGLADPYVKGQIGPYSFKTKTQKKTLAPKWQEEFKIPIITWESSNVLAIEVRDKDRFVDDTLGVCSVDVSDLRDGQRHDMWLSLKNIKTGRLHLAITVLEVNQKGDDHPCDEETLNMEDLTKKMNMEDLTKKENMEDLTKKKNMEDKKDSSANGSVHKGSFSPVSSEKFQRVVDNFEAIDIDGQRETGIWVHHPGSEVSQTWEPRKGKSRRVDNQIQGAPNGSNTAASGSPNNDNSSTDENPDDKHPMKSSVRRGIRKIGSVFHWSPKKEDRASSFGDDQSPCVNLRAVDGKRIGVKFVVEDIHCGPVPAKNPKEGTSSPEGSDPESPSKGNMKDKAKSFFKHSAHNIKHVLSRKGSRKSEGAESVTTETIIESESSDDESFSPVVLSQGVERIPVASEAIASGFDNDSLNAEEHHMVQTGLSDDSVDTEGPIEKETEGPIETKRLEDLERKDGKAGSPNRRSDALDKEPLKPKVDEVELEGDKR